MSKKLKLNDNGKIELSEEELAELLGRFAEELEEEETLVDKLVKKSQFLEVVNYFDIADAVPVFTAIDAEASLKFINRFKMLESMTDEDDYITVWINTPGGSVTACMAIVDCIKSSTRKVRTVATGMCASAGFFILAAGDVRLATKQATLFYHEPIMTGTTTTPNELHSSAEFYNLTRERLVNGLLFDACENVKRRSQFKKKFDNNTSWYITPEVALEELGLIHKII